MRRWAASEDGQMVGVAAPYRDGGVVFLGIQLALVEMVAGQRLRDLVAYSAPGRLEHTSINCTFSPRLIRRSAGLRNLAGGAAEEWISRRLTGEVLASTSGVCLGLLPLGQES